MKMEEYIEGCPIYLTPFILKCRINIYSINKSVDKNDKKKVNYYISRETVELPKDTMYAPVVEYLPNLCNEQINILFKSPHYDSLGNREFVNNLVDIYINPYIILVEGYLTLKKYEKYKTLIVDNWEDKSKKQDVKIIKKKLSNKSCKVKSKRRYFEGFIIVNEKDYKGESDSVMKNKKCGENSAKAYKNLNNYIDTNFTQSSNESNITLKIKYILSLTKCIICNNYMNHRLPCGCLICHNCSKDKILSSIKENNIKLPLSVCVCGYILNDKDRNLILKN
jgi:hypothetical protein